MTTATSLQRNTAVATTAAVTATTQAVAAATQTRNNRRKVKDFNDSITCSLCSGYLIEATTVNDCLHTFCRSCIVRYLECNKYCPKCKSYNNKTITVANLRPDRILKSLVYKLVPGLYKSENQRVTRFYSDQCPEPGSPGGTRKLSPEHGLLEDQNFFSPDELISLSLEYHYESIADYDPKRTQLPVTYLHCPAAVTIHHLYKFILTKNGLQVDSDRIQVDIIYEDEILPHEFTLMDVAYCFDYRRVSPMRLFYRIFIHPTAKPTATTTTTYNVNGGSSDKNSNANNNSSSSDGSASGERDANNSNTTTTTSSSNVNNNNSSSVSESSSNLNESQGGAETSSPAESAEPTVSPPGRDDVSKGNVEESVKSVNSDEVVVRSSENKPAEASCSSSYKSVESKYDSKLIITKTNKVEKVVGGEKPEKESLKLVLVSKKSDKNSSKVIYSKGEPKSSKSPKQNNSSPPPPSTSPGDFKRLRSSDIRYSEYETASTSSFAPSKSGTVPGDDSRKSESQKKHNKINNDYSASESSGKKFSGDNSRNKTNGSSSSSAASRNGDAAELTKSKHEKSKSSPHQSESNGSAVAITASIGATTTEKNEKSSELKCYVNLKKQTVVSPLTETASASRKPEVPKLKIELPSLKTKISIPKQDSPKSVHSSSTSSSAATSPTTASSSTSGKSPIWQKGDDKPMAVAADVNSIGIEEYAKTIGLKPVYRAAVETGESKKKKKSSTTSSPDPSSSHRKRKKAKHSKEVGGKRRKLHAEISSQHETSSSLKMKVKLTEKPSKHERKPSEEISKNAEVGPSSSAAAPPPPLAVTTKKDDPKVIDITKGDDDDDVKIIEQPALPAVSEPVTRVNELPKLPTVDSGSTKAKISEMRAIRHKPMVYIPNPIDKNLSDASSSTINNLIQSVQAKTGFIDKDNDVQIVTTTTTTAVKMPPLVPTKPVSTVASMKPPAVIPSTVGSRIASAASNSIPKPQQKMFSPRHSPNYPPLALSSAPKKVAVAAPISSTNIYQPRSSVPAALKRSSSVDSGSTYNMPPKTPRVDLMEAANAANRLLKKPCYAPMFNFVKGASLAKNGTTNSMPTSANDVPYKSPISSTYTKEIATKKSVPSLLLPPSSISVTKMTDVAPQPAPVDNRPALEIVRIPSTAPVADKPQQPKTTRPPPPTIPLIKIKKSTSMPEHPTSPISPSVFQVTSSNTTGSTNLTTSSASSQDTSCSGALDLTTRANDDLIILESDSLTSKLNGNDAKPRQPPKIELDNSRLELINSLIQTSAASMIKAGPSMMAKLSGIPGLKLPADMIGFAITSSSNNPTTPNLPPTITTASKPIPMPKLAEISSRPAPKLTPTTRQPNPSVRNIPNPSALAFRNQSLNPSFPATSPTRVLNSQLPFNGGGSNNNNNNNKSDVSSTSSVSVSTGGNKKTIEKVAAGLRAAAATVTVTAAATATPSISNVVTNGGGNRVSSSSSASNGSSNVATAATNGGKNGVNVV